MSWMPRKLIILQSLVLLTALLQAFLVYSAANTDSSYSSGGLFCFVQLAAAASFLLLLLLLLLLLTVPFAD